MNDLISRQDAVSRIADLLMLELQGKRIPTWDEVHNAMQDLPSANQWIPCSERLPEEEKNEYWICTDSEYQCSCRWTNDNPFWHGKTTDWHWNIFDIPQYSKVVAWMPLPQPWKEVEDES